MTFSWKNHKKPIVALAPMAGYTDTVFRQLVKELAPSAITISELASSDAIHYSKNEKTLDLVKFQEIERPYIVQLFGKKPEMFAEACKVITEKIKPDGIDINMGCPARKVINSGHGSALLKDPDLACEIIRTCKENTNLPISVKTRLGWNDPNDILKLAPLFEEAGADALLLHGRTYSEGFSGESDWTNIYKVKEILNIPVLGNGDVKSKQDFDNKLHNLDGILIGRATFGNPWLIGEITGECKFPKKFEDRLPLILRHADLAEKEKGNLGMMELRKHLATYVKGLEDASARREKLVRVSSAAEVREIFSDYLK